MSDDKRYLLAFEDREGKGIVLEFDEPEFLAGKETAAGELGIWCQKISVEDFTQGKFQGARYFRMSDPVTCRIFFLEQWTHLLRASTGEDSIARR